MFKGVRLIFYLILPHVYLMKIFGSFWLNLLYGPISASAPIRRTVKPRFTAQFGGTEKGAVNRGKLVFPHLSEVGWRGWAVT